jgi:hypothetical protein
MNFFISFNINFSFVLYSVLQVCIQLVILYFKLTFFNIIVILAPRSGSAFQEGIHENQLKCGSKHNTLNADPRGPGSALQNRIQRNILNADPRGPGCALQKRIQRTGNILNADPRGSGCALKTRIRHNTLNADPWDSGSALQKRIQQITLNADPPRGYGRAIQV